LFRALYSEILPNTGETWTKECLKVNRSIINPEGTFEAAGVGTATTSRHYDEIIEDDTITPKKDDMTGIVQQPTQADIEKAIGWHRQCHPLLVHSPEYKKISRAIYENSDGEPARPESGGSIIWPDRFGKDVADALEKNEGPYMFASLYMNSPTSAINQVFKREWIRYYSDLRNRDLVYCTSVDLASATKEESSDPDYTVIMTCAVSAKTNEIFVVHYTRGRLDPGQTIEAIFDHVRTYKPLEVIVESIGYQRTLNYWLKKRMNFHDLNFYINEVKGLQGSKVDRIRGLQPYFANNQIFLKARMSELEQELLAFPKGSHDDLADALSMQVKFWYNMVGKAIIDSLKKRSRIDYPYDVGSLSEQLEYV